VAPITGLRHEDQRLNVGGPVTMDPAMSRWGGTQKQAAPSSPTRSDKNVGPDELAAYAGRQGYGVGHGVNGDLALMKKLFAAGFPVIVETWVGTGEEGAWATTALRPAYTAARTALADLGG